MNNLIRYYRRSTEGVQGLTDSYTYIYLFIYFYQTDPWNTKLQATNKEREHTNDIKYYYIK